MVQQYRQVLFDDEDIYYLIPELVRDRNKIPLCTKCGADPRANKFSVANGHDYGRIGNLPELNDVTMNCIVPARGFGIEISLSGTHSSGHVICFPSNGPAEMARVLPNVDPGYMPRVTFVGPAEEWRVQQNKFRKLYTIQVDEAYKWLSALAYVNDIFRAEEILVKDCSDRRRSLHAMGAAVEASVYVTNSSEMADIQEQASSERFGADLQSESSSEATSTGCASGVGVGDSQFDSVVIRNSAVLSCVYGADQGSSHDIIDAMLAGLSASPVSSASTSDEAGRAGEIARQGNEHRIANSDEPSAPTIPIKRGRTPLVEWLDNAKILAGMFPNLFLTGARPLPSGPLPSEYADHFIHYWDGRFEKSTQFTTVLFNHLQRHAAVQKAARVGVTHGKTMAKLGKLTSTPEFKQALKFGKDNPDSPEAIRLNAGLLRLLSLVGGYVPFSPFERAATRPKLAAMRYCYGIAQYWVTIAPPEHDDLFLHRIAQLRAIGDWNDPGQVCSTRDCRFSDLPEQFQTSARSRLDVSRLYPALAAQVFERRIQNFTRAIMRCHPCKETHVSRSYLDRPCGVYGPVATFNAVIEPQVDGRLHVHVVIYGGAITPELLTRLACCPELWPDVRRWLDATTSTSVPAEIRRWCAEWQDTHRGKVPRAFDVPVPDAATDFDGFIAADQKRALSTNTHTHSLTCRKGNRGRFMCWLTRPAGVHDEETQPLMVRLKQKSNPGKRKRAEFAASVVSDSVADFIDRKRDFSNKRVLREHTDGAIVWELRRPASDAMFVETNLGLACLSGSHTNSAIINGKDAGDMVEEYQQSYMTKEKGGLKCGAAVMLTALSDIEVPERR